MKTFFTINLGCRVNLFETNAITYQMLQNGFKQVDDINKANIVIVNTCSVTNKADAKSRNMINRAKQAKLKPIVLVMGCFAQVNREWFKDKKIDIVVGTQYKNQVVKFLLQYLKNNKPIIKINKNIDKFEEFGCIAKQNNTRAIVKIQDGCDFYCSYCLIPYCRGKRRSMDHKHVLNEIKQYVALGFKEIVITGINTATYNDGQYSFLDLLQAIDKIKGNFRVRISSVEPFQMIKGIIDLFANNKDRWANYLHLCLQAADNKVLSKMNRKYTIEQYINFVKYIRQKMKDVAIATDYIVAFGDETDKEFENALKNLKKLNFANMNVFIYSRRNGTVADKRFDKNIDPIIARKRYDVVDKIREQCQEKYLKSLVGKTLDVLVERSTVPNMHGYSSEFALVRFKSKEDLWNKLVKVKISRIDSDKYGYYLVGKKVEKIKKNS